MKGSCTNPSCDYWHPPVCQNHESESECAFGDKCLCRHTKADRQPSKKSGGTGSVALLNESKPLGCVFQDAEPPESKSILRRSENWDHIIPSSSPWAHGTTKKRERNCPSSGVVQKLVFVRRNLRIGHRKKPCNKNDAPAEKHGIWQKNVHKLNEKDRVTFFSLAEVCVLLAPSLQNQKESEICGRFQSINAHTE